MINKQIILPVFLVIFLMCWAGNSFAQHTADTVHIGAMKDCSSQRDTAVLSVKQNMLDPSPEIIQSILRYGTMNLYNQYPFSSRSAQYPMALQPEMPYNHSINGVMESMQKSLNEYYKKYHQGQTTGEVLSYLSLLLFFL